MKFSQEYLEKIIEKEIQNLLFEIKKTIKTKSLLSENIIYPDVYPNVYPDVYPSSHNQAGEPHPNAGEPHPNAGEEHPNANQCIPGPTEDVCIIGKAVFFGVHPRGTVDDFLYHPKYGLQARGFLRKIMGPNFQRYETRVSDADYRIKKIEKATGWKVLRKSKLPLEPEGDFDPNLDEQEIMKLSQEQWENYKRIEARQKQERAEFSKDKMGQYGPVINWKDYTFIDTVGSSQFGKTYLASEEEFEESDLSGAAEEEDPLASAFAAVNAEPQTPAAAAAEVEKQSKGAALKAKPEEKKKKGDKSSRRLVAYDEYGRVVPATIQAYLEKARDKKTKSPIKDEIYLRRKEKMLSTIRPILINPGARPREEGSSQFKPRGVMVWDIMGSLGDELQKTNPNPNKPRGFQEKVVDFTAKTIKVIAGTPQLMGRVLDGTLTIDNRIDVHTTDHPLERSNNPAFRELSKFLPIKDLDKNSQLKFLRRFAIDQNNTLVKLRKYLEKGYANKGDITIKGDLLPPDQTKRTRIGKVFKNDVARDSFFSGLNPDGSKPEGARFTWWGGQTIKHSYKWNKLVEHVPGAWAYATKKSPHAETAPATDEGYYFKDKSFNYEVEHVPKRAGMRVNEDDKIERGSERGPRPHTRMKGFALIKTSIRIKKVNGKPYRGPGWIDKRGPVTDENERRRIVNAGVRRAMWTQNQEKYRWVKIIQTLYPAPHPHSGADAWGITEEEFQEAHRLAMSVPSKIYRKYAGDWHRDSPAARSSRKSMAQLNRSTQEKLMDMYSKRLEAEVDKIKKAKQKELDDYSKSLNLGGHGIYGFLKEEINLNINQIGPPPIHLMRDLERRIQVIDSIEDVFDLVPIYIKQAGHIFGKYKNLDTRDIVGDLIKHVLSEEGHVQPWEAKEMALSDFGLSPHEMQATKFWEAIGHIFTDTLTWVIEGTLGLLRWVYSIATTLAALGSAIAAIVVSVVGGLLYLCGLALILWFVFAIGRMICKAYDMADICYKFPSESELAELMSKGKDLSAQIEKFNDANWGYSDSLCRGLNDIYEAATKKKNYSKKEVAFKMMDYWKKNNTDWIDLRNATNSYGAVVDKLNAKISEGMTLLKTRSSEKHKDAKKRLDKAEAAYTKSRDRLSKAKAKNEQLPREFNTAYRADINEMKAARMAYRESLRFKKEVDKLSKGYYVNHAKLIDNVANPQINFADLGGFMQETKTWCKFHYYADGSTEKTDEYDSQQEAERREKLKAGLSTLGKEILKSHSKMESAFFKIEAHNNETSARAWKREQYKKKYKKGKAKTKKK